MSGERLAMLATRAHGLLEALSAAERLCVLTTLSLLYLSQVPAKDRAMLMHCYLGAVEGGVQDSLGAVAAPAIHKPQE